MFPAVAQEKFKEKRWGVRLGVWSPVDAFVRDVTKDWWIYFGLENYLSMVDAAKTFEAKRFVALFFAGNGSFSITVGGKP